VGGSGFRRLLQTLEIITAFVAKDEQVARKQVGTDLCFGA
jgi:hypothetical protein